MKSLPAYSSDFSAVVTGYSSASATDFHRTSVSQQNYLYNIHQKTVFFNAKRKTPEAFCNSGVGENRFDYLPDDSTVIYRKEMLKIFGVKYAEDYMFRGTR